MTVRPKVHSNQSWRRQRDKERRLEVLGGLRTSSPRCFAGGRGAGWVVLLRRAVWVYESMCAVRRRNEGREGRGERDVLLLFSVSELGSLLLSFLTRPYVIPYRRRVAGCGLDKRYRTRNFQSPQLLILRVWLAADRRRRFPRSGVPGPLYVALRFHEAGCLRSRQAYLSRIFSVD